MQTVMQVETVTISKSEYDTLLDRDRWLCALECAGVDNWQGWDEAIEIRNEWYREQQETEEIVEAVDSAIYNSNIERN